MVNLKLDLEMVDFGRLSECFFCWLSLYVVVSGLAGVDKVGTDFLLFAYSTVLKNL